MARHSFCQHRVSLLKTRRMNYDLTLKGHIENFTQSQGPDLIGRGNVAYQSICIVVLNTLKSRPDPSSSVGKLGRALESVFGTPVHASFFNMF